MAGLGTMPASRRNRLYARVVEEARATHDEIAPCGEPHNRNPYQGRSYTRLALFGTGFMAKTGILPS